MSDNFQLRRDNQGIPVAGYIDELDALRVSIDDAVNRLNQLVAKIPPGLSVDSSNRLKAVLDTASSIYNYEMVNTSSNAKSIQIDGPIMTRTAWGFQRNLLNIP